jgi:hypothetical protein
MGLACFRANSDLSPYRFLHRTANRILIDCKYAYLRRFNMVLTPENVNRIPPPIFP